MPLVDAVHPDDRASLSSAPRTPRRARPTSFAVRTARVRHADGRWRLIQATVRDLRADPDVGALVLYCRDVTSRVPAPGVDPELPELSLTDPVTGLPNRAALVRRLGAVQRERRPPVRPRPHRHRRPGRRRPRRPAPRTTVLRALTARLTRALRGEDWLARGKDGDFVVLVDGSIADAETVAARLVAAVGPLPTAGGPLRADRRRRRHRPARRRRHRRGPAPRRPRPPQRAHRRPRARSTATSTPCASSRTAARPCAPTSTAPSTAASCGWSSSRSSTSSCTAPSPSRRCCAGGTRCSATSPPPSSCRWPRSRR